MENSTNNTFERIGKSIKSSITLKLFSISILILLLLIPVSQVRTLISEREGYRYDAVREVSEKWGGQQTITGPILTIPYKTYTTDVDKEVYEHTNYAHFLPENLRISSIVNPEIRKRGIYEIPLYNTRVNIAGDFTPPDLNAFKINPQHIQWEDAFVSLGIPDMVGIKDVILLKWNKESHPFEPGLTNNDILTSGVNSKVSLLEGSSAEFSFDINLNGSEKLNFVPLGKKTNVKVTSTWTDPSFNGRYIPDHHEITEEGFEAEWNVFDFNRNYPQQWLGDIHNTYGSEFGVDLFMPVNHYQKNMRSAKYAILIITLTFLVYFFFEILNKRKIHPFQYILIGLSLSLFYTLLLSITEHFGFDSAYLISSIMVISLIVGYSSVIFNSKKLTTLLASFLALIFGFIYVILQLQDYSLLVGSVGLFVVLGVTMYLSRKIDWYALSSVKN
ncbi:MAG: cell envelope integrity protein CreD [Cyclobacteriaceae bacterium]|nr:cell envelope integrity protein CreD [Cyclobacteriaceae bacterium]